MHDNYIKKFPSIRQPRMPSIHLLGNIVFVKRILNLLSFWRHYFHFIPLSIIRHAEKFWLLPMRIRRKNVFKIVRGYVEGHSNRDIFFSLRIFRKKRIYTNYLLPKSL